MTATEALFFGAVWGVMSHSGLAEGFALSTPVRGPLEDEPAIIVLRGKKSGVEVLITITESRTL